MKEIFRGAFIIFIFKIMGAISLFLTYILIPRYYGVEAFGIFNLMFGLIMVATVLSRIGLDIYVIRIIPTLKENYGEVSLFLKRVLQILFMTSISVTLVFLVFLEPINEYIFKSMDASFYLVILALMILPYTLFNVLVEVFRGLDDIKIYSFFRNLSQNGTILLLLFSSIVFSLPYQPVEILFIALILITIAVIFVLFWFLKKREISILAKGKYQEKIVKHAYPMFLTASIMFLMGYVDSFMIAYYLDEYQVGIYGACISLSMILTFIPIAIGGYISPKIAESYDRKEFLKVKALFKDSLKLIFLTTIPIFVLMIVFADFFLGLFGTAFVVATTTLLIINFGFLSEAICGPVGFVMNMTDNQHIFMKILGVSLLINIIFNALLIPSYGINGAAIALLLSMLFWTISSLIILKIKDII
ncbi:MAG: O-antigen translocase [uncultured Sulfurovum sp.]|uniref:O-antigen translocase n=1 Tax=uncultured Sulfurovum sp. TaxID=269237 RepID=A0A6S6SQ19_9BACT|nr:MAG: O-antigen translocase [uncultured Sulfurovum sp.]